MVWSTGHFFWLSAQGVKSVLQNVKSLCISRNLTLALQSLPLLSKYDQNFFLNCSLLTLVGSSPHKTQKLMKWLLCDEKFIYMENTILTVFNEKHFKSWNTVLKTTVYFKINLDQAGYGTFTHFSSEHFLICLLLSKFINHHVIHCCRYACWDIKHMRSNKIVSKTWDTV